MAETLHLLSIILFASSAGCFILVIFLWFLFKIPDVIGDLSGRTARKSIARMRAANEKSESKFYKESKTNAARGKLTGAIPETGMLNENKAEGRDSETTGLLVDNEATVPLNTLTPRHHLPSGAKDLKMLEELILIHTDEVIES